MLLNLQSSRLFVLFSIGASLSLGLASCGGGAPTSSNSGGGNPPPAPAISSISPSSVMAGSGPVTLTVNGTGFLSTSIVQVNGTSEGTTYVSSVKLTAVISAAQIATGGQLAVVVLNGSVSSGTGTPAKFEVDNPVPTITSLSPSAEMVNTTSLNVNVVGTGFVTSTTIDVNGSPRPTTVSGATQAQVTLTPTDVGKIGALAMTAINPAPGGGTSPSATLMIGSVTPPPVILSVTPDQILEGSSDTQISVQGTGFSNNSVVYWNGAPLTLVGISSSGSATILAATVPAVDLSAKGTGSVTVSTPSAIPALSNALPVTIYDYPSPTATGMSPTAVSLNTPTTITITGAGFTNVSVILINGAAQPTGFISSSSLTAQVPASLLSMPGVLPIRVTTPAPGGGTSAPQYLTAYVPIVNNSMVYNPANGLFYLSVPSSAGVPYGNTVVSIDPLTGALGVPIPVGAEPDQLAITADGRYLWVALDGASSVRRVDLQTGVPGPPFTTVPESSGFAAAVLAAVPSQTDSVIVATPAGNIGQALAIYDSGVIRGTPVQATFFTYNPWGLVVDSNKNEIYAAGSEQGTGQNYATYTYDASGLTQKFLVGYNSNQYASQNNNEIELVNGSLYTDFGQVYNPENATLLGSFFSSGSTLAQGSTTVDTTQGLAFVLEGGWSSDQFQLQGFKLSDFSQAPGSIQTANPSARASYMIEGPTGNRLTRWGSDGLAYRTTGGFISLRTSLVKDLSSTNADLGVTLSASGPNSTGSATIYTAKVTNQGPAPASSVALLATLPATGVLTSTTSLAGTCSGGTTVICNLGSLSSGASATVTFTVQQASAGTATMTVQVNASENDPVLSNNLASSNLKITGADFSPSPTIAGVLPQAILNGSSDTTITVTGSNFAAGATVLLNGSPLATTFTSSTELRATVPAADLIQLGWAAISVLNQTPGGGTSSAVPFTIFSTMALGANHIVYDPYSRKIMAAVSTGSTTVAGNSIVAIDPVTESVGMPVAVGGTPTVLALSTDGNILYALVPDATSGSVMRYNMLTQRADFSVSGFQPTGYNTGLRDLAAQPGFENTVAVDEGEYPGISIFDFDPVAKTATRRGSATGTYTGTCLAFPSANNLLSLDLYTSPSLVAEYTVTSSGLVNGSYPYAAGSVVQNQNCYKLNGDLLVTESGGVSSTGTIPLTQLGVVEGLTSRSNYSTGLRDFEADSSLRMAYFLTNSPASQYNQPFDSISGYDLTTFMPARSLVMPFPSIENGLGYSGLDVVRWGQDGLAVLTTDTIYFVRGPVVVPELLNSNAAAILNSSAVPTIAHGSGNTMLTLTGSNFVPGVAVTWNGSYRTTTVQDAKHVTVAIPASDVAASGRASVVAVNPGGPASNAVSITIN